MKNGGGSDYPREPLTAQDNANHREMWEAFKHRRWLRELAKIWLATTSTVATLMLGLYALWQIWRGGK
jgi:hypothetical protein